MHFYPATAVWLRCGFHRLIDNLYAGIDWHVLKQMFNIAVT